MVVSYLDRASRRLPRPGETPTAGPPGINQNRERIQSPFF